MSTITNPIIINKIQEALEQMRPFLKADGGDMELIEVSDKYVVKIKFLGACSSCSMSAMTLQNGVAEAVKKAVPEIQSVESIN